MSEITARGHPREPATFEFSEHTMGPNGYRRVIHSYVAWDSSWPLWKRVLAPLRNRLIGSRL